MGVYTMFQFLLWSLAVRSSLGASLFESLTGLGELGTHFGFPGNASFDYVIVGGGTAGLALANRLSKNSSVAVVEAGSFYEIDNGNKTSTPALGLSGTGNNPAPMSVNPKIDWEQFTEPQTALNDLIALYPSGKTLGGGSARNYQVYQRGTIGAYDLWSDTVGDQSYTFDALLPYFQKSTTFYPAESSVLPANLSVPLPANANAFAADGGDGPIQVSYSDWQNAFNSWATLAFNEIGVDTIPDFFSGQLIGQQVVASTQDPVTQQRCSSEYGYLRQAFVEQNMLTMYTNTLAKQILFDDNKNAQGVVVNSMGSTYTLSANQEVIVSAGAFRSPQMLMVSGVGPSDVLNDLDIPVVADRPGVGQNMWDHVLFGPSWNVNLVTHAALAFNDELAADSVNQFNNNQSGILTNIGTGNLGWEKLPQHLRENLSNYTLQSLEQFPADWPEVEFIFLDAWLGTQADTVLGSPHNTDEYVSMAMAIITPFSRGNVTINSTDTAVHPRVNPNWLLDERDMDMAIQLYKRGREFFNTTSIEPILVGEEAFPGSNITSDADIETLIRGSASTVHHASCTCRMGMANDTMAVVDNEARVIGVNNLRVVDASAMPFLPPGHPQATIYALAEKIADLIMSGQ